MNRTIFVLLLPAFLACAVDNTVAGDDQTAEEKLGTELSARCASLCSWATQCPPPTCDCTGDACGCAQPIDASTCPANCEKSIGVYQGKGDTCASAGLNILTCLSGASCASIFQSSTCQPDDATRTACTGASSGPPSDSSGSGVAGSGSGGAGSTGSLITCQSGSGAGVAGSANTSGTFVSCAQSYTDCSDGHSYDSVCVVDNQNEDACSCFVDSALQITFTPSISCPDLTEINARCGWSLTGL